MQKGGQELNEPKRESNNTVAVVTGAASGIGYATVQRLVADGYRVVGIDADPKCAPKLAEVPAGAGGAALAIVLDVRDGISVERTVGEIEGSVGSIDLLVNVAGIGIAARLHETSPAEWDRVLGVNLTGVYLMCHAVLPMMLQHRAGVIINVASVAGLVGVRDRAAYCASKAGIVGLTRSIAVDYAHLGIRANAICPGTVDTEWIGKILANSSDPLAMRRTMEERQLDGRMGSPAEVAAGIAFLAGPDGRFMNGSALVMDGGMTAQ